MAASALDDVGGLAELGRGFEAAAGRVQALHHALHAQCYAATRCFLTGEAGAGNSIRNGLVGDIYGNVFVRDANGKILLEPATDKDGNPNAKADLPQVTTDKAAKIGNFNPDWTLGWSNTVTTATTAWAGSARS